MAAVDIDSFAGLKKHLRAFADGKLNAVMVVGPPGQGKSEVLKGILGNRPYLYLRGKTSAPKFYEELFLHQHEPVILDDTHVMLENADVQEMLRDLTETTKSKRISWRTQAKFLEQKGLPTSFTTSSRVCVIANSPGSGGVWDALYSRCHRWNVAFSWEEICREAEKGGWFKDQEILRYAVNKATAVPDARLLGKAKELKTAGLGDWRDVFELRRDQRTGAQIAAAMLSNASMTSRERVRAFAAEGGGSRASFYRRQRELRLASATGVATPDKSDRKNKKTKKQLDAAKRPRRGLNETASRTSRGKRGAA